MWGYHEYTGGCSVHCGDTMSTLGDIMSTLGGYHDACGKNLLISMSGITETQ